MKPLQSPKDQGISPHLKDIASPNTFSGTPLGGRPDLSKVGISLEKDQTAFETNIPYSRNPAQSSYSDELHQDEYIEGREEEGLTQEMEEDKLRSYADTEEDPEIRSKKRIFSRGEIGEDVEDHEKEGSERQERTPTNFISLSESLKAMKNLRSNFESFGWEVDVREFHGGVSEGTYKEIDEEDYVKVESADDEHLGELDTEQHHEEYYKENEEDAGKAIRGGRDQYIEKIHEEAHEESRREDEEEEHQEQEEDKKENEKYLEEDEGNEEIEKPDENKTVKEEENEEDESKKVQDEIKEQFREENENKEIVEENDPEIQEKEEINEETNQFIPQSPLKNECSEEGKVNREEMEEKEGPPTQINTRELELPNKSEQYGQEIKEKEPEIQEEKVVEPMISQETKESHQVEEESKPEEEKPPMFFSVPKQNLKVGEKPKMTSPFVTHKPNPNPTTKPFVNTSLATSAVLKQPEAHIKTPLTAEIYPEFEKDTQDASESTLILRLKRAEIELRKERKKNESLEEEREKYLVQNKDLKKELQETKSKLETFEKSRDVQRLSLKEQETIDKLRAELKSTLEGSRLVNEHSNRIINESGKFKQEMENLIESLNEDKKQLQQTILQLKTSLHEETLKTETLNQRANLLEHRVKEYENSFELIQKQFRDREKTVKELTSLNQNAQNTLQTLPKIDDILLKLTPQITTVSVQTSLSQLPIPKDISLHPQTHSENKAEDSSKLSASKTKSFAEKIETPFSVQKNVFSSNKKIASEVKPPQSSDLKVTSKPDFITRSDMKVDKSFDFEDDLNLLMSDKNVLGSKPTSQSLSLGTNTNLKTREENVQKTKKVSPLKPENKEKDEKLVEETKPLSEIEKPIKKSSPNKEQTSVSYSQDIKPLLKETEDLSSKKKSAGIKDSEWEFEDTDIFASLKEPHQYKENQEKTEPTSSKIILPQGKPIVPKFVKASATEETKKKTGGLVLNKVSPNEQEKSALAKEKPGLVVNLGNIPNKSSSRYTLPKKGINQSNISSEADNFFDELGINDTPASKGGNLLRESTTSIHSATSKQGGNDPFSQPGVAKKKGSNMNQFV